MVSRESTRIDKAYSVLNVLEIFVAYIRNVHLQAPSSENHCITHDAKFGL